MNYIEWNDIIAKYIFNPEKSGCHIFLYLSKKDIIRLAKPFLSGLNDFEVWNDFISALKKGVSNSAREFSIIQNTITSFNFWKTSGHSLDFPTYLTYLVFFVTPLIEGDTNYRANNYYDKLNEFLELNNFNYTLHHVNTSNFKKIEPLWSDLEFWSCYEKSGESGVFELINYSEHFRYVGKPFSQCLLSPKTIKALTLVFHDFSILPFQNYSDDFFEKFLILHQQRLYLSLNILSILKDKQSELRRTILSIVQSEYKKWDGEIEQIEGVDNQKIKIKNDIRLPLYLQFRVNSNEEVEFSYRLYSKKEYPEDLKFDGFENLYERNGWSKTLKLPYKEEFKLIDDYNKWVAVFLAKDIRFFINAAYYQLSNSYWIETQEMNSNQTYCLLSQKKYFEDINTWASTFENGSLELLDYDGIPDNYFFARITNPDKSSDKFDILSVNTHKKLQFENGLKIGFSTFFNKLLPFVKIENSQQSDETIVYQDDINNFEILEKVPHRNNLWYLSEKISPNAYFTIKIFNEDIYLKAKLVSDLFQSSKINEDYLPKRNKFGIIDESLSTYFKGSNVLNFNTEINHLGNYSYEFRPVGNFHVSNQRINNFKNDSSKSAIKYDPDKPGNILLSYLTTKKVTSTEDFYQVFESLHSLLDKSQDNGFNFTRIKRISLNLYDYLGFIDYDYESKKIVVNPPQLVYIPTEKGRKLLLIGGRDENLINQIINQVKKRNLQLEIIDQDSSNRNYLLPDIVRIIVTNNNDEEKLSDFSKKIGIKFMSNEIIQGSLLNFSASIIDYYDFLLHNCETDYNDYNWVKKTFCNDSFRFIKTENTLHHDYELAEYKFNEYEYIYKLWIKGVPYKIDKNWGRYLILDKFGINAILYDSENQLLGVPLNLPLPRIISEAFMLLSGLAPTIHKITFNGKCTDFNIYKNIPSVFTKNFFRLKLNQIVQPFTFKL